MEGWKDGRMEKTAFKLQRNAGQLPCYSNHSASVQKSSLKRPGELQSHKNKQKKKLATEIKEDTEC